MTLPPFLLTAAILFWGWQSGLFVVSALMAITLEVSRFLSRRWQVETTQFYRISDLSTLLLVGMVVYFLTSQQPESPIFSLMRMMPFVLFPLTVALAFSTQETLPLSVLFYTMRKETPGDAARPIPRIALGYPFFGLCLVCAGAAEFANPWYYPLAALLTGWGLWPFRSRRYPLWVWAGVLLLAGGLGFVGHQGLSRLQKIVANETTAWLAQWLYWNPDPYRRNTDIGDIGALKLSDHILFRVALDTPPEGSGFLLQESSFNFYYRGGWNAYRAQFHPVRPGAKAGVWSLGKTGSGPLSHLTVFKPFPNGRGLIPLPMGTARIARLPARTMEKNQYAAVKVHGTPKRGSYRAFYDSQRPLDEPPGRQDLQRPFREKPILARVVASLGLQSMDPVAAVARLRHYFLRDFRYSVYLENPGQEATPIGDFLLHTRSGHCEYFATATVLLLRQAGIPARYAVGFSVQEYSESEEMFIIRRRHAHAWALGFLNGRWQNVDTTPPDWSFLEAEQASRWQPLWDLWSRLEFLIARLYDGGGRKNLQTVAPWVSGLLVAFLVWRNRFQGKLRPGKAKTDRVVRKRKWSGKKVPLLPLYRIEQILARAGWERKVAETWTQWQKRVGDDELLPIVFLHNRFRFDPQGLTPHQEQGLVQLVEAWIKKQKSSASSPL